jgi:hypothetical protein
VENNDIISEDSELQSFKQIKFIAMIFNDINIINIVMKSQISMRENSWCKPHIRCDGGGCFSCLLFVNILKIHGFVI